VALDCVFTDVAAFNACVMGPTHIARLPEQEMDEAADSKRNVAHHVSYEFGDSIVIPAAAELDRTAEWLNRSNGIIILAGAGALGRGLEFRKGAQARHAACRAHPSALQRAPLAEDRGQGGLSVIAHTY
jgi:thiamine pyrophosphate-dependent acetolactate synthase large subunit-like protein